VPLLPQPAPSRLHPPLPAGCLVRLGLQAAAEGAELEVKYFEVKDALGGREKGICFIEYTQGSSEGYIRYGLCACVVVVVVVVVVCVCGGGPAHM
jgi:hypothetical protein